MLKRVRTTKPKACAMAIPRVMRELAEAFFELIKQRSIEFQAVSDELGISLLQVKALFVLGRERTMSEVAEAAHCEPSNLTGVIDKLEARGLVERRGAANDRRIKMVFLTPGGTALRRRVLARLSEPAPWMLALSESDQRKLRDIFTRALGHSSDESANGAFVGEPPRKTAAGM
jgi:DNA-binding MarR family transcriptional regulator